MNASSCVSEDAFMSALRIILALDLGVTGAGVTFHDGIPVEFFDTPCLNDRPAGRRNINAALLAERVFKSQATAAFVEAVGPRPSEGAVGAFAFGRVSVFRQGKTAQRTQLGRRLSGAGPTRPPGSPA
jgi:hypothetical protein